MSLYLLHFVLPVPFMLLYELKTDKFNRYYSLAWWIVTAIFLYEILEILGTKVTFFTAELITLYFLMVGLGIHVFTQKHDLPQALSLSFNLAFFNSLYWEIPIHIYTPLYLGFLDATTPLHLIYAFPAVFLLSKLRFPNPARNQRLLFLAGVLFSALCLVPALLWHPYLWGVEHPFWLQQVWNLNRIGCYAILLKVFVSAEPVAKAGGSR